MDGPERAPCSSELGEQEQRSACTPHKQMARRTSAGVCVHGCHTLCERVPALESQRSQLAAAGWRKKQAEPGDPGCFAVTPAESDSHL